MKTTSPKKLIFKKRNNIIDLLPSKSYQWSIDLKYLFDFKDYVSILPENWKYKILKTSWLEGIDKGKNATELLIKNEFNTLLFVFKNMWIESFSVSHINMKEYNEFVYKILSLETIKRNLINLDLFLPSCYDCLKVLELCSEYSKIKNIKLRYEEKDSSTKYQKEEIYNFILKSEVIPDFRYKIV